MFRDNVTRLNLVRPGKSTKTEEIKALGTSQEKGWDYHALRGFQRHRSLRGRTESIVSFSDLKDSPPRIDAP